MALASLPRVEKPGSGDLWLTATCVLVTLAAIVGFLPVAACPTIGVLEAEMQSTPSTREYRRTHPNCIEEMHERTGCRRRTRNGRLTLMDKWRSSLLASQR